MVKIVEKWIDGNKIFGDILIEITKLDPRVVFVGADSYRGGGATNYRKKFPDKFIELGIAEQNACGFAAGLAFAGKKPFFSSIANFVTQRCYEQIRDDIVIPKLNVVLAGRSAGISSAVAGPTHNTIDDISVLRGLPGIIIVDPGDLSDFRNTMFESIKLSGPIYFRKHKQLIKKINPSGYVFKFGKAVEIKSGTDVAIIACGTMVYQAFLSSEILEKVGISTAVINMHTIKPLDEVMVNNILNKIDKIVTVEEHSIINGLGSAVSEVIAKNGKGKQLKIGFSDEWPTKGLYMDVLDWHGLTGTKIAKNIIQWLKVK